MPSFDEVFAAVLEGDSALPATPFEDSLHAWDELLSRTLPCDFARPEWAEALGVTLPCTDDDLRRAFRRAAFVAHPDRGGSSEAFMKVTAALEAARQAGGRAEAARLSVVTARYAQAMGSSAATRATIARAG